jgi:RHS repeat-associated protein
MTTASVKNAISTTEGGTTRTVTTGYDTLGRVTSYTDADGNTATTTYDHQGRPTQRGDGKGQQSYTYDATTGLLTAMNDSHAGAFAASYDADGRLKTKTLPNGVRADYQYDAEGAANDLSYTRTTGCSANCEWYAERIQESVHDQWRKRTVDDHAAPSTPSGLVAAYGLNAGSGTATEDASGNANHATLEGGASWVSGKHGHAVSLDGVNDLVRVPHSDSLFGIANGMTVEAWVNPQQIPAVQGTIARRDDHFALWLLSSGRVRFSLWKGTTRYDVTSPNGAVVVGTWQHVAATWDGQTAKLYVDGVEKASLGLAAPIEVSWDALYLGSSYGSGDWFNGRIDEARVYDRPLSSLQIQGDMRTAVSAVVDSNDTTDDWVYRYDSAGRLVQVEDTPAGFACTTRSYSYDKNSNRQSRTTRRSATGTCDTTSAGDVQTSTYDAADRLNVTGAGYDSFGRMTNVPASHVGDGTLQTAYYVNDMVRSQTQFDVTKTWLLDPTQQRHRATLPNGGVQEILHYADDSDAPAWSAMMNGTTETSYTRNIEGIDGDLAAIYDSQTSSAILQLTNLHGDIVATASTSATAGGPLQTFDADEFGNPKQTASERYGWLGGEQRRTVLSSGIVQMGRRSYIPAMGRFTSVDPIRGGSASAYDYGYADPVNNFDLSGCFSVIKCAQGCVRLYCNLQRVVRQCAEAIAQDIRALITSCFIGACATAAPCIAECYKQWRKYKKKKEKKGRRRPPGGGGGGGGLPVLPVTP